MKVKKHRPIETHTLLGFSKKSLSKYLSDLEKSGKVVVSVSEELVEKEDGSRTKVTLITAFNNDDKV